MAKKANPYLVAGRKVFAISSMPPQVLRETGWTSSGPVLVLDDGTLIFAGAVRSNEGGRLFGKAGNTHIHVTALPELSAAFRGRTIRSVRKMTPQEMADQAWSHHEPPAV